MKNTLNRLFQVIAGCVAVVFFVRFLDNFDYFYLAGMGICIAAIFGLRTRPGSGNLSISETMMEKDKKVASLSLASFSFILTCGAAAPLYFGVHPTSSEIIIFVILTPIGLLLGALLVVVYQWAKLD